MKKSFRGKPEVRRPKLSSANESQMIFGHPSSNFLIHAMSLTLIIWTDLKDAQGEEVPAYYAGTGLKEPAINFPVSTRYVRLAG